MACFRLCGRLFAFVLVFFLLVFCLFCLCFDHEAWEYSLDYVQVRIALFCNLSILTDMHGNLSISFRQVQTC